MILALSPIGLDMPYRIITHNNPINKRDPLGLYDEHDDVQSAQDAIDAGAGYKRPLGAVSAKQTYCARLSGIIGMCADVASIAATLSGAGAPLGVAIAGISVTNTYVTIKVCGPTPLNVATVVSTLSSAASIKFKVANIMITTVDAGLGLSSLMSE